MATDGTRKMGGRASSRDPNLAWVVANSERWGLARTRALPCSEGRVPRAFYTIVSSQACRRCGVGIRSLFFPLRSCCGWGVAHIRAPLAFHSAGARQAAVVFPLSVFSPNCPPWVRRCALPLLGSRWLGTGKRAARDGSKRTPRSILESMDLGRSDNEWWPNVSL